MIRLVALRINLQRNYKRLLMIAFQYNLKILVNFE